MLTSCARFASTHALLVASFSCLGSLAAPDSASAQATGGTIVIEGTFTLTIPTPPPSYGSAAVPEAPTVASPYAPPAPPLVTVLPPGPPTAPPRTLAAFGPRAAQADVTAEPTRTRRRWGLVATGAGLLLGGYALSISGALSGVTTTAGVGGRDEQEAWSFVPIIGPLVGMVDAGDDFQVPVLLAAFALEAAGLVMAIVGTASRVAVRPRPGRDERSPTQSVSVVPYASGTGAGIAIGGAF